MSAHLRWGLRPARARHGAHARVIGSDSVTLGYGYDAEGRFERLRGFDGRETRMAYDRFGRPDTVVLGNGGRIVLEVPWTGVPSEKRYQGPPAAGSGAQTVLLGMRYGYDPRLGRYDGGGLGAPTAWRSYGWDLRGRLTRFADGTTGNCQPTYGAGGGQTFQPTVPGEAPTSYQCATTLGAPTTYAYDAFGNRTSGTTLGARHRLQTATVEGVGYTFEHDSDGHVTRKVRTASPATFDQRLAWDGLGQLTSVTTNGQTVEYGYDAAGLRVRRTVGAQTVYSLWDGAELAAELDGATGTTQRQLAHYPGVDQPHSLRAGGPGAPVYYHAQDALGHVVALLDSAGQLAQQRAYVPFGDDRTRPDSGQPSPDVLRWKARERDPSTGLYYVRARLCELRHGLGGDTDLGAVAGPLLPRRGLSTQSEPPSMSPLLLITAATSFVLIFGGAAFMYRSRDVAAKRRVFPWYLVLSGLSFLAMFASLGFGWTAVLLMAIPVGGVSLLNVLRVRICPNCGRTSWGDRVLSPPDRCPECGHRLEAVLHSGQVAGDR